MGNPGWKKFEGRIARLFGGQRRGADYRSKDGGKNDVIVDGWSIECKLYTKPTYQLMFDGCIQAEKAKEHELDIPIAVIKKKGVYDKNALVIMRLETFMEYFGSTPKEDEECPETSPLRIVTAS